MAALQVKRKRKKTELLHAITTIYLFLMLTVFLFWCGPDGYQAISDTKNRLFLIICGGYILVMVIAALESVVIGALKLRSPLSMLRASSWPQRLVLIYILLTWVSALLSEYFPQTILGATRFEGALTITIYGICFLFVSVYGRPSKWLLGLLGCVVFLFSVLCLVQMARYNPFGLYPQGYGYADAGTAYSGDHLYTMDAAEMIDLLAQGWNYENVAFNSAADTEVAQYRLWNPNVNYANGERGAWHFTSSTNERDQLIELGWQYQGIGWYSEWV